MGSAADMLRQRRMLHKKKAEERTKRTEYEKNKRRNDEAHANNYGAGKLPSGPSPTGASAASPKDRQVAKSFTAAPLPGPEQEKQLVGQLYQSLRVPEAADAIGTLIRHLAQKIFSLEASPITKAGKELIGSKRGRDEASEEESKKPLVKRLQAIVNGVCAIGDDEDYGNDRLTAIIKDECGNRVLCALLRAIYAHHDSASAEGAEEGAEATVVVSKKHEKVDPATVRLMKPVTDAADHLVDLVLYLFSAGQIPEDQHTAMRVLVVIADFGSDAHKAKILKYIRKKVKRADAAAEAAAVEEAEKRKAEAEAAAAKEEEEDNAAAADGEDADAKKKRKTAKKAAAATIAPARTVSSVLLDRHIANVTLKLLAGSFRDQTVAWLNNQLLALTGDSAADADINLDRIIKARQLINLVEDNVAGNILQSWVHDSNREFIFFNVLSQPSNLSALIKARRGCRFLAQLLTLATPADEQVSEKTSNLANKMMKRMLNPALATTEADAEDTAAEAAVDATVVVTKKLEIVNMAIDAEGNYVAQRIFALLPAVAAHNPTEALLVYKKVIGLFDDHTPAPAAPKKAPRSFTDTQNARKEKGYLQHVGGYHASKISQVEVTTAFIELAVSSLGCHSLIALLEGAVGAAAYSNCKIDLNLVIDRVFKTSQAQALMADQHGGLVLRKFLAALGAASKKASDKTSPITAAFNTTVSVVESHLKELMYDPAGNLVVQQLLAALPAQQVASLYQRFIQKSVVEIATHASAAHVLVALLDIVDAKVHADIAQQVKPSVLDLATHLNGRFVVEKLIPNYSDIRETITNNFGKLAKQKGTQHVLVALWNALDDSKAKALIEKTIIPNITTYAVDPCSSIVIQKLLQDSQKRIAAADPAKASLCKLARVAVVDNAAVKKNLIHDRFGRFIVWVLDSSSQPILPSQQE